jgi:hypothetical protein
MLDLRLIEHHTVIGLVVKNRNIRIEILVRVFSFRKFHNIYLGYTSLLFVIFGYLGALAYASFCCY